MTTYDFTTQLAIGAQGERALDALFARWYDILPASDAQQRRGIDRIFVGRSDGRAYTVEYKTDSTAARTGNAFIELVSVDAVGKPGWAHTSQATLLAYAVDAGPVYVLTLAALRAALPQWQARYPHRHAVNAGYRSEGVCVPLSALASLARWRGSLATPPQTRG